MKKALAMLMLLSACSFPVYSAGFDYCKPPDTNDKEAIESNAPWLMEPVEVDLPKPDISVSPPRMQGDITTLHGKRGDYQIVLVPVGYQSSVLDQKMQGFAHLLHYALQEVPNVSISYFFPSVDIKFETKGRLVHYKNEEDVSHIMSALQNNLHQVDQIIFVLNSELYLGSGEPLISIFSGENPKSYYLMVHETGHSLGLEDGYEAYYPPSKFPGTEFFTNLESLSETVARAYDAVRPAIYPTENFCDGEKVFAFTDPTRNIMGAFRFKNDEAAFMMLHKTPIFSNIQLFLIKAVTKR